MRSATYFLLGLFLSIALTLSCFGPGPIETLDPVYTRPPITEDEEAVEAPAFISPPTQEEIDEAMRNAHPERWQLHRRQ